MWIRLLKLQKQSDFKRRVLVHKKPVNDILTVTLNEESTYSIVNVNGQVLKNGKLSSGDNTLRTSQLSKGLYFLNIRTDSGFIFKKLVKQ